MGKSTNIGRADRGSDFLTNASIWAAFGRTEAWPDESAPPEEDVAASTVEDVFAYKLFTKASLAKESSEGTGLINISSRSYDLVSNTESAITSEQPTSLYLNFSLGTSELLGSSYRQIGVFLGLAPVAASSGKTLLLPSEVATTGYLVYLENSVVRTHYADTIHELEVIINL